MYVKPVIDWSLAGDVYVAFHEQIIPQPVHELAEPRVVVEREVGRIDAAHPRRQRGEIRPIHAPHRAARGVDDGDARHLRAAPADRRPAERAEILRVPRVVEL